eukprot:TRINITY_DN1823_c0_g2_i2.p1 TRINITY_DN1823_c0_g2~~TRINITY_DN1823_c0_g2_i2.p1  ORF type:complete len:480 (-),score=86.53 TRINITY_DN1823_c0_g2_i2:304-1743(-)
MNMSFIAVVLATCLTLCSSEASQLPTFDIDDVTSFSQLSMKHGWWATVGGQVVRNPHRDSGLSPHVGDYYYAYGSHAALNDELLERRVGGDGRVHIFHLPEGPESLLQKPKLHASRRTAVSGLVQLSHKAKLSDSKVFPEYAMKKDYTTPLSDPGQKLEAEVVASLSQDSVMQELQNLTKLSGSAGGFPTRSYSNPAATAASVKYIQGRLKSFGYETCLQKFHRDGVDAVNVVAYIPGSAKSKVSEGAAILGGHYDSRPYDDRAPGAVDNGSGAAALLSIAKSFANKKVKPHRPIFFVAFAAEEPGLWGSEEFVKRLDAAHEATDGTSLRSTVCSGSKKESSFLITSVRRKSAGSQKPKHHALILDEVAWKSPNIGEKYVVNMESYDWSTDVLEHLAQASRMYNGDSMKVTHSNHPFGSDHMSFLSKKHQAVLSIHGDDEGYPHYHTSQDVIENVDPELYKKIIHMNAGGLLRLSGVEA